jgi:heme oxygenase
MFAEELKKGTTHAHTTVEKKLVNQIRKISTVEDYIQLLKLMCGYYMPLQEKITPFLEHSVYADRGRQADNIKDDILALKPGYDVNFKPCTSLPHVNSFFDAYGDQTAVMWEKFKSILNAGYSDLEKEQIMNAANETFSKFNEWINLYESSTDQ